MPSKIDPTTFGYQNFYSATLTGDITAGSLAIGLDTVPTPTSGILVIDPDSTTLREVIYYSTKGATTVTCPVDGRAWDSSTATAHLQGTTVIMGDVADYFRKLGTGELSTDPLRTITNLSNGTFISSGGIIATSAGLIGTCSNTSFYLNGQPYTGSSIANKTYTASKDTYVDITGVSGGGVSVLYTEVVTNAASPALTTNYIRLGIVVTAAAITSINQGSPDAVAPTSVVSSGVAVPYAVCDSNGVLIYPRPNQKLIGFRRYPTGSGPTTTSTVPVSINSGMHIPVLATNVPNLGNVRATYTGRNFASSAGIADGLVTVGSAAGAIIADAASPAVNTAAPLHVSGVTQITANTTILPCFLNTTGTASIQAFNGAPTLYVELD